MAIVCKKLNLFDPAYKEWRIYVEEESYFAVIFARSVGRLWRRGRTGTLEFRANGEDFVRQGFTSKDGWRIDFDHVYVTLEGVTAYQTDPPYDASTGVAPESETVIAVEETMTLDLAAGDENAEPLLISSMEAPAGQYNALSWSMVNATEGDAAGHTVVMDGMARERW